MTLLHEGKRGAWLCRLKISAGQDLQIWNDQAKQSAFSEQLIGIAQRNAKIAERKMLQYVARVYRFTRPFRQRKSFHNVSVHHVIRKPLLVLRVEPANQWQSFKAQRRRRIKILPIGWSAKA